MFFSKPMLVASIVVACTLDQTQAQTRFAGYRYPMYPRQLENVGKDVTFDNTPNEKFGNPGINIEGLHGPGAKKAKVQADENVLFFKSKRFDKDEFKRRGHPRNCDCECDCRHPDCHCDCCDDCDNDFGWGGRFTGCLGGFGQDFGFNGFIGPDCGFNGFSGGFGFSGLGVLGGGVPPFIGNGFNAPFAGGPGFVNGAIGGGVVGGVF